MSQHPLDPSDATDVARQQLRPDSDQWNDKRMRAARPRLIHLAPDGSRETADDLPEADADNAKPAS
ncbi:hypothetical protein E3O25_02965 [Cryobacterium sp. TMT1-3]|uniref:hypothetical protein n=1 Tax=Cryobacterium sp. TMT1-3 TaxID=1259237 RepID=UPI001068E709|nr:hypothetical protein [Cryobacterium sp. TMT1-3]TFC30654.1 hypothetical protein E3O25_02965 [Cryobacterium sp. TMT1-3]